MVRTSRQRGSPSTPTGGLKGLTRLLSLVSPYKSNVSLALLALLVGSSINLIFPEVIRRSLDPASFGVVLENLPLFIGLLVALFVVQGCAFYLRSLLFGLIGQQVFSDVRNDLFRSIVEKEIPFFDKNPSGDLASRLNSDAALVQELVSVKLSVIVRYGVQVILGTCLMAWMSWRMTGAIVLSVVCLVVVSGGFSKKLRAASKRFQGSLASLTAFAAESFAGAKVIRALGAEEDAKASFLRTSREVFEAGQGRVRVSAAFSSGASLLLNVLLLGVLWYGISLVTTEQLPVNDLAAFALYGSIVAVSFAFLIGAYSDVVQALGGLDRVLELLEEKSATSDERTNYIGESAPSIECRTVTFAYPQRSEVVVLDELSLSIAGGSTVGIMGPSGSGKSSFIQLLLKFYTAQTGSLTINGADILSVSNTELRSKVAWVPQEPHLFATSIAENLALGNPTLTPERIEKIITQWGFLDFIFELPEGLATRLGEHGSHISGGQRQRIAIARALLRNPQLLLLDEATSGLDSALEDQVLTAIRRVLPNSTVVIVSHRLSSVRHADKVFVINEGRVVEQGTDEELKRASGLYHHYAARQSA